jgi:hypothetical protein
MASMWRRNNRAAIESIFARFPQRSVTMSWLRATLVSQTSCIVI